MDLELEKVETKDCEYCAEKVLIKAKKCKHCGEILDNQLREIESLKQQVNANKNVVISNNNNNNNNAAPIIILNRKNYPWFWHLVLTCLTGGAWLIIWLVCYLLRDRKVYN
jgi:uncharacterized membrane protein